MSSVRDRLREVVERMRAQRSSLPCHKVRRGPPPVPIESPVEVNYRTALAGIADRQFCESVKYGEQQFRADRFKADPRILEFERLMIKRLRKLDVPFFAHCIWRNEQDQNAAYVRGVSRAKWGESPHNFGCAVDLIHGTKAWDLTERQWSIVGHIGKELAAQNTLPIAWGGDFKSLWDPAHWELTDWQRVKAKWVIGA